MRKLKLLLLTAALLIVLFVPQTVFADNASITLQPGHHYVIEGVPHAWDESVHGPKPLGTGYPIKTYTVGDLEKTVLYDYYRYDGLHFQGIKNFNGSLEISFEVDSNNSLTSGGKTYFTISASSPETILNYRSDIVRIKETSIPTFYTGILEPGNSYEFTCSSALNETTDFAEENPYSFLAFFNDVALKVNGEIRELRGFTDKHYSWQLSLEREPEEEGNSKKTIIEVPASSSAITYYAPGENFSKHVKINGEAVSFTDANSNSNQEIQVLLDGKQLSLDVPPTIINGRTLVPLRVIFEAMGADIEWNNTTKTVTAQKDATSIMLSIGNTTATVNGQPILLDVAGVVVDGRTLVPARFIAESLGADVQWNSEQRSVVIRTID